MLSRVASSLYWMSRYLQRAEHTARVIDVNLVLMLDQAPAHATRRWERLFKTLHMTLPPGAQEPQQMVERLLFERGTPQSLLGTLTLARDNARQVRNQLSSEMWEQINRLYLQVNNATIDDIWGGQTHALFRSIKEGVQLVHGISEATVHRDEGWHFLRIGRFIERSEQTISLLSTYFDTGETDGPESAGDDYLDMVSLLKSRTAFEAYCQVYTADLQAEHIVGFLLLSDSFPHSVRFATEHVQTALRSISALTHARNSGQIDRHAGRLRATLEYAQINEVMDSGLLPFLQDLQRQFAQLHRLLQEVYFQPPLQAVLAW
jgi:uncharacterized alpha-E superfamily protein